MGKDDAVAQLTKLPGDDDSGRGGWNFRSQSYFEITVRENVGDHEPVAFPARWCSADREA